MLSASLNKTFPSFLPINVNFIPYQLNSIFNVNFISYQLNPINVNFNSHYAAQEPVVPIIKVFVCVEFHTYIH